MSSIPSILVRSTMSTIKKELEQLEQWLNREWTEPTSVASPTSIASVAPVPMASPTPVASLNQLSDVSGIYQAIQQLSKQLEVQQHTLNHIIDRMDVLEDTKEVHISSNDPWLDSAGTLLQNELDEEHLDEYEPIINVRKAEEPVAIIEAEPVAAVEKVEVEPVVVEPVVVEPVVVEPVVVEPDAVIVVEPVKEVQHVAVVEPVEAVQEVIAVEPVAIIEVEEEEEEQEEEEEEEQEEEEEEEEDDMEYEEIEYNGTTYYRDTDKFVYTMNKDGELSEHPIGYWKEKSKAITFYKK